MPYPDSEQAEHDVEPVRLPLGLHERHDALLEGAQQETGEQRLPVPLAARPDPAAHRARRGQTAVKQRGQGCLDGVKRG